MWNNVIQGGKYPNLSEVVKNALTISHGSASIERGFSLSGRVLSEERASMNERTLNAKLFVIDGLGRFGGRAQNVAITEDLIKLAKSARKSYDLYLEQEKALKEKTEKERQDLEARERLREQQLAETSLKRQTIETLKKSLKEKKEAFGSKEHAADELLKEAHNQLKKGIEKKDMVEIQLAQAMIDGTLSMRTEQKKVAATLETAQQQLE